MATNNWE